MSENKVLTVENVTVNDLIPEWCSYIMDLESCLEPQKETWKDYRKDATPYIVDLLCDFGNFPEEISGKDYDAVHALALAAAKRYTGKK